MTNILNTILANIELATAIVAALVALGVAIAQGYKRIKAELNAAKSAIELAQAAVPLINMAESKPINLMSELVNKPDYNIEQAYSNEGKNNIVAQALIEREPSLLKKLKLKDVLQVGNFVSAVYTTVKPIIKGK